MSINGAGRDFMVGDIYTIVEISAGGWIDRALRVLNSEGDRRAA
jgi:GSH-dependent disulfide-bond oxidoreductase